MNKPYVICHMLQSIDGRISGQFFHDEATQNLANVYKEMGYQFHVDGIIYGSVTAAELFTSGNSKQVYESSESYRNKEDYIVNIPNKEWVVIFDPEGELNWTEQSLMNTRLVKKNIIVILSNHVSSGYTNHLKKLGISYTLGNKAKIDLIEVMDVLSTKCNMKRLLLQGGGILNGSFINENLVDELSLIISPTISTSEKATLCFEGSSYSEQDFLAKYSIIATKLLSSSGVWLQYKRRK